MEPVTHVIATVHEVALKGANRGWFERTLLHNIRACLRGLAVAEVTIPARVVVAFSRPVPWGDVFTRLSTVFGINGIIPVQRVGTTYEQLEQFVAEHLNEFPGATFAVRCKRSDKRFPLTSEQVNRKLGDFVRTHTSMTVCLDAPDVTFHVLVQSDGLYLFRERYPGPGGLPVGTSGRVLVLLSGGIDSPAAAYLTMKRGTKAHYVHFHSAPYTSDASVGKVERLMRVLVRHQGSSRLAVVPFGDCQREIVSLCPERLRVVLYRRMMLRTSERIARRWRCEALVTGESLNQVASQTLENLAAIDRVAHMPVLRPLIGMDKQEIIAMAERAGTYELSLLPHPDCCSFLQPQHPATRSTPAVCDEAERAIDVDAWARRLQHEATTLVIQHNWENEAEGGSDLTKDG